VGWWLRRCRVRCGVAAASWMRGGGGLGIFPLSDRADKGHERMRRAGFGEREREAGWVPCVGEH
jgi:hypothetical protein